MEVSCQLDTASRLIATERVPITAEYDAGWTTEPVWMFWGTDHLSPLSWIEIESLGCVARNLTTVPTETSPLLINVKKGNDDFGIVHSVHRVYLLLKKIDHVTYV